MTLLFDGGAAIKAVLSVTILPLEESGRNSEEADGEEEWGRRWKEPVPS